MMAASAASCSGELNHDDSSARREEARVVETCGESTGVCVG
jgi:hypothetical protein